MLTLPWWNLLYDPCPTVFLSVYPSVFNHCQFMSCTCSLCMAAPVTAAKGLNSVTSLSGRTVQHSQYPLVLPIVSSSSSFDPHFAHRLHWGGGLSRDCLNTKRKPLLIGFLSQLPFFLLLLCRFKEGEWDQGYPLESFIISLLHPTNIRCLACTEQSQQTLWLKRRHNVSRQWLFESLQQRFV